jgi:hypothetical protein
MRTPAAPAARAVAGILALATLTSCTGGINAGEQGGRAFIGFTVMLVLTAAILYFVLGREE